MDLETILLFGTAILSFLLLICYFVCRGRISTPVIGSCLFAIFFIASQIGVRFIFPHRADNSIGFDSSLRVGTALLVGAVIGMLSTEIYNPSPSPKKLFQLSWEPAAVLRVAVILPLSSLLLGYVILYLANDSQHPIWLLLQGKFGTLSRDILFEYASQTTGPLIFQPSFLRSVVSGLILPLGLLCNEQIRRGRHSRFIRLCGRFLVGTAIIMTVTRFKRFPVIELVIPFLTFYAGYAVLKRKTFFLAAALIVVVPILLSAIIYGNNNVIDSLMVRSAYVESMMDNFALSSGFDNFLPHVTSYLGLYWDRIFGDGSSPSLLLKSYMLAGEGRGYDSLSFFSEIFVMFGAFAPFVLGVVSAFWHRYDRLLYKLALRKGVLSIWCVYTSIMGIGFQKGIFPKLFSGGGIFVFLLGLLTVTGVLCVQRSTQRAERFEHVESILSQRQIQNRSSI